MPPLIAKKMRCNKLLRLKLLFPLVGMLLSGCSDSAVDVPPEKNFRLQKVGSQGEPMTHLQGPWSCVKDLNTGLIWEVKTDKEDLRDYRWNYSWFNADDSVRGVEDGGSCFNPLREDVKDIIPTNPGCHTMNYVEQVNRQGLCGYSDWRLPDILELATLIDNDAHPGQARVQEGFFPRTKRSGYWTSNSDTEQSKKAWAISFQTGDVEPFKTSIAFYIRLVRGVKRSELDFEK